MLGLHFCDAAAGNSDFSLSLLRCRKSANPAVSWEHIRNWHLNAKA